MEVIIPILILLGGMLLGVPIAFSLIGASVLGILLITGDWNMVLGILKAAPFRTAASYTLSAVPMFILLAYITSAGGIARDLFNTIATWVSRVRGGLAIATIYACAIFGAMSGASLAAATVMSKIAMPQMRRHGYSEELASGAIAAGSTLDLLIPPSISMVIFGLLTETSVGKLLLAGVVPGIVAAGLMSLAIYLGVTLKPSLAPLIDERPPTWMDRFRSLRNIWPSVVLIVSMMVLLYSGVATATEVASLGVVVAVLIGVAMRRLTWAGFMEGVYSTVRITSMIFLIILGGHLFGYFLSLSQISTKIVGAMMAMDVNRWILVCAVILFYFVMSMFMDELPLLIITLPITFPLVTKLGFDPVWFGVISILNVAIGMLAPPVGIATFVVSATAGVSLDKVYIGASLLVIPLIVTMILVMIFPQLALWLPSMMR